MSNATQRTIIRTIHILVGLPLIGHIYGPQEEVVQYVHVHRYFLMPILLLSGLWMWKGHLIVKLFSRNSTEGAQQP